MKLDCMKIPIRDHDCVVVLNEEFARYGPDGKDLDYGIIYGTKWILPLDGTRKRQLETADYVKLLNDELLPEIKNRLYALYLYFKKYQQLPEVGMDITELMSTEMEEYNNLHCTKHRLESPFTEDTSESSIVWADDDYDEDDLDSDIYSQDDLI